MASGPIRLMVSSAVYGIEDLLAQVFAILKTYGYEVWMSHMGTIPVSSQKSNFENCLEAVRNCDVFLGIITGSYGTGQEGDNRSITHQEVLLAIELDKIRFFAVHHLVTDARQLLKQFRFNEDNTRRHHSFFKPTKILDDIRVIEIYDAIIRSDMPVADRTGNWAQQYSTREDLLRFIETQFSDIERLRAMLAEANETRVPHD